MIYKKISFIIVFIFSLLNTDTIYSGLKENKSLCNHQSEDSNTLWEEFIAGIKFYRNKNLLLEEIIKDKTRAYQLGLICAQYYKGNIKDIVRPKNFKSLVNNTKQDTIFALVDHKDGRVIPVVLQSSNLAQLYY